KERKAATILSKALKLAKKLVANKERNAKQLRAKILKLIKTEPLAKVDYAEVRNAKTLARIKRIEKNKAIIALAVFIGKTRLIDNEKI
ncbi:MAG: pantoate--beta-alanine ligase, partial [Candidatus Micrarchaeia archaeon]